MPRFWPFFQSNDVVKKVQECLVLPAEEATESSCSSETEVAETENIVSSDKVELPTMYYAVSLPARFFYLSLQPATASDYVPTVFAEQIEALKIVKEHCGSRFKAFGNIEEAKKFASVPSELNCPGFEWKFFEDLEKNASCNVEKGSSAFRLPKRQDVVELRKSVMSGDCKRFRTSVWENPRYLINLGDTPMIYYEGYRYNALHVAAKHKQPGICKVILETVEDPSFMMLLYPDDSPLVTKQRVDYVLDLYLNMPEKRLCETPLHFAAKFGCLESVQVLASHPFCDQTRQNKYGLTARVIICERCPSASIDFKQQIEEAFEAHLFVPVLRSQDNSVQPIIGKPCPKNRLQLTSEEGGGDPCNASLSVMAIAGPMSPKKAKSFYRSLKSPMISKVRFQEMNKFRLSDVEKGVERFGRDLAHGMKTTWTEYWPCLDLWCDLTTEEGLETLEQRLAHLYHDLTQQDTDDKLASCVGHPRNICQSPVKEEETKSDIHNDSGGLSILCSDLENFHISDRNAIITSPDMPHLLNSSKFDSDCSKDSFDLSSIASPKSYGLNDSLELIGNSHFDVLPNNQEDLENNYLNARNGNCMNGMISQHNKPFHAVVSHILKMFYSLVWTINLAHVEKVVELTEEMLPEICDLLKSYSNDVKEQSNIHKYLAMDIYTEMCEQFSPDEKYLIYRTATSYLNVQRLSENSEALDNLARLHLKCIFQHICGLLSEKKKEVICSCQWTCLQKENALSNTYRERYPVWKFREAKGDSSDDDDVFYTPPSSPTVESSAVTPDEGMEVFVHGNTPSKDDLDLLHAIEGIHVDALNYPHITRWIHLISTKDDKTKNSWLSPAVRDFRMSRRNSVQDPSLIPSVDELSPHCSTPKRPPRDKQKRKLSKMLKDLEI